MTIGTDGGSWMGRIPSVYLTCGNVFAIGFQYETCVPNAPRTRNHPVRNICHMSSELHEANMTHSLLIGITARKGDPAWIREHTRNYIDVLHDYGVDTVVLSPDTPVDLPGRGRFTPDAQGRLPDTVLDHLDGLVLAGGGDVHPAYFGAQMAGANPDAIDLKRDELELALARQAYAVDLPVFGICRGCQVMNVAAGGGMVQDFTGHRSSKETPTYHDVTLLAGSRLRAIVGRERLPVNTYHHQGLDAPTMATLFAPTGMADPDTWLVEAFESAQHRWAIGVQWHPERLFELDPAHIRLWDSFVSACSTG